MARKRSWSGFKAQVTLYELRCLLQAGLAGPMLRLGEWLNTPPQSVPLRHPQEPTSDDRQRIRDFYDTSGLIETPATGSGDEPLGDRVLLTLSNGTRYYVTLGENNDLVELRDHKARHFAKFWPPLQ